VIQDFWLLTFASPRLAEEEEKKRKRAERFGVSQGEPAGKKTKA
jgi:hypothetical protein